jgi:hypothetical protein
VRPPLAGKGGAVRRLAGKVRRQKPATDASSHADDPFSPPEPAPEPEPRAPLTPAEAEARIDAARDRLRATIEPPDLERD